MGNKEILMEILLISLLKKELVSLWPMKVKSWEEIEIHGEHTSWLFLPSLPTLEVAWKLSWFLSWCVLFQNLFFFKFVIWYFILHYKNSIYLKLALMFVKRKKIPRLINLVFLIQ